MANGAYPPGINPGMFVPTTDIFDTQIIYSININSQEFKEFLVRLTQNINTLRLALNIKDSGYYVLQEFVNGQSYFQNLTLNSSTNVAPTGRQVFRMVVNFGQLPNTGTTTVAHNIPNINSGFSFTRIYATASDTTGLNYIPIPYASNTAGNEIELRVDATNVFITTGSNRSNFNICYVVLEYIKQ